MKGAQGTAGTNGTNGVDGKTVLNGTVAPTAGVGQNGDFYINTTESKIYGPKASGAWPAGVSLKGAQGSAGADGAAGATGATGASRMLIAGLTNSSGSSTSNRWLGAFLTSAASSNESEVQQVVPVAGTVSNLSIRLGTAPDNGSGTQKYTFTVRKNGADAFGCEVVEAATTCSSAGTATFAAGDQISLQSDPSGTAGNDPKGWSSLRWAVTLTN